VGGCDVAGAGAGVSQAEAELAEIEVTTTARVGCVCCVCCGLGGLVEPGWVVLGATVLGGGLRTVRSGPRRPRGAVRRLLQKG
jgi:hypothetical protein